MAGLNLIEQGRLHSPWITHFDTGSCNGCDIEVLACLTPKFDVERFGILNKGNPKHTDVFLVTGPVTKRSKQRLINLYEQAPGPKVVIAIGSCACTGGVYGDCYNVEGGIDQVLPVDRCLNTKAPCLSGRLGDDNTDRICSRERRVH